MCQLRNEILEDALKSYFFKPSSFIILPFCLTLLEAFGSNTEMIFHAPQSLIESNMIWTSSYLCASITKKIRWLGLLSSQLRILIAPDSWASLIALFIASVRPSWLAGHFSGVCWWMTWYSIFYPLVFDVLNIQYVPDSWTKVNGLVGSVQSWSGIRSPFLFPNGMRMSGESWSSLIWGRVSAEN